MQALDWNEQRIGGPKVGRKESENDHSLRAARVSVALRVAGKDPRAAAPSRPGFGLLGRKARSAHKNSCAAPPALNALSHFPGAENHKQL